MGVQEAGSEQADCTSSGLGDQGLSKLALSVLREGDVGRLRAWFTREFDDEGVPRRLPVGSWISCLRQLAQLRAGLGSAWTDDLDAFVERFFLLVLRFMRPDGSMVFGEPGCEEGRGELMSRWAEVLSQPGFQTVLNWWFPKKLGEYASPPLPAWSGTRAALAALRADWLKTGSFISIDHRQPSLTSNVEWIGQGRSWLGPTWTFGATAEKVSQPRPITAITNSAGDYLEWSVRAQGLTLARSALILRGRRLALLADQVEGGSGMGETRIALPGNVEVLPAMENRSVSLSQGPRIAPARVIPLAIPRSIENEQTGALRCEGGQLVLRQPIKGRRTWFPLLLSWEPARNRKTLNWQKLTVTEQSRICAEQTAVAFRVGWGRDESLVVYRSLERPATRSFLGYRTDARFLVGLFNRAGNVEPLLKVKS